MLRRGVVFLICLGVLLPAAAPAMAFDALFSDVPATHWAAPVVEQASALGLMQGMGDGRFGLGRSISRAEFVTVLSRMFGWLDPQDDTPADTQGDGSPVLGDALSEGDVPVESDSGDEPAGEESDDPAAYLPKPLPPEPEPAVPPAYTDVHAGDWFYAAVCAAAVHGATEAGERFRPRDPITRREMAVMLVRGLGYDALAAGVAALSSPFLDVTGDGYVNIAYDIGMALGDGDGRFRPDDGATREEAAAMLSRVFLRYTAKVEWVNGFFYANSFPQIDIGAQMDCVSFAWARMMLDEDEKPYLNLTSRNDNHWYRPERGDEATAALDEAGVPYTLTVFSGSATALKVCADAAERAAAIEALVAAAAGYAGLTVDFEGMQTGKDAFSLFMQELRAALPASQTLSVCVPPLQYYAGGFDFRALGEVCDKVILMAHDYQWPSVPDYHMGTDRTDIVIAPAEKVYRALREITSPETGVADRSKVALAINFAAYGLHVDENGLLLSLSRYNPYLDLLRRRLRQPDTDIRWSERYQSPFAYYYTEDGGRYIMWYEDARSVQAKILLARMFGVNSISFWRLGGMPNDPLDGIYYNVWETVQGERLQK